MGHAAHVTARIGQCWNISQRDEASRFFTRTSRSTRTNPSSSLSLTPLDQMSVQWQKYLFHIRAALTWSHGCPSSLSPATNQLHLDHVLSIPPSSSNDYPYQPLDMSRNEIRLIKVCQPDDSSGLIACTIEHTSLDSAPEYEALSYTWSDSDESSQPCGSLLIDGHKISVTRNLSAAVREIFLAVPGKAFWVDALCINQMDVAERNSQVSKMKTIYKTASRVVTWLGDEYENSAVAFRAFRSILDVGARKTFYDGHWQLTSELDQEGIRKAWALILLYSRPYWERVWIVQEIAFAKDLVICCGRDRMEWAQMQVAIHAIRNEANLLLSTCPDENVAPHMITLIHGGPVSFINCFGNANDVNNTEHEAPLGKLLILHRYKMSSDPRDKVFSMLGLTSLEMQKRIPINYDISIAELLLHTITVIVEGERDLAIILENKRPNVLYRKVETDSSLPSWVPYLNNKKGKHLGLISQFSSAWAGACGSTTLIADIRGRVLKVRGIVIGRITAIGTAMPEDVTAVNDHKLLFSLLYEWWKIYFATGGREIVEGKNCFINIIKYNDWYGLIPSTGIVWPGIDNPEEVEQSQKYKDGLDFAKADARMCVNILMAIDQPDDTTLRPLLGPELIVKDPKMIGYARRIISLAATPTRNRRFMAAGKYCGLAPLCAEIGDIVVVVLGSPVLLVLRERAPSIGGGHLLVGDAYLHGFMDGEAVIDVENGTRSMEDLEIH